jgi:hypothetical protein
VLSGAIVNRSVLCDALAWCRDNDPSGSALRPLFGPGCEEGRPVERWHDARITVSVHCGPRVASKLVSKRGKPLRPLENGNRSDPFTL